MKFIIKKFLICSFILSLFSAINAQQQPDSSILPSADDEWECGLISPPLIQLDVLVWSSIGGYLNSLTYKDFEISEKEKLRDIEFFKFDKLKNQYTIGFYQKDFERDL